MARTAQVRMEESPEVADEWPGWDALKPAVRRVHARRTSAMTLVGGVSPRGRQRTVPTMSPPRPSDMPAAEKDTAQQTATSVRSPIRLPVKEVREGKEVKEYSALALSPLSPQAGVLVGRLAKAEEDAGEQRLLASALKKDLQQAHRDVEASKEEAGRRGRIAAEVCKVLALPIELEHPAADDLLAHAINERVALLNSQGAELAECKRRVGALAALYDLPADASCEAVVEASRAASERGRSDAESLEGMRLQLDAVRAQAASKEAQLRAQMQDQAALHETEILNFKHTVSELQHTVEEGCALAERQARANEELRCDLEAEIRRRVDQTKDAARCSDEVLNCKRALNDARAQQHAAAAEVERVQASTSGIAVQVSVLRQHMAQIASLVGLHDVPPQDCVAGVQAYVDRANDAGRLLAASETALLQQREQAADEVEVHAAEIRDIQEVHQAQVAEMAASHDEEVQALEEAVAAEKRCVGKVSAELTAVKDLMKEADVSLRSTAESWEQLQEDHNKLEDTQATTAAQLTDTQAKLRAAESSIEDMREEQGASKAAYEAMEEGRKRLEKEVVQLTRRLEGVQRQALEASSVSLQSRIAEVKASNEAHDAHEKLGSIMEALAEVVGREVEPDTCVEVVRAVVDEKAKLHKSNRDKAQRLQLLEKGKQMLKDSTLTLEKERAALMAQLEALQKERAGLRRQRSEAQTHSTREEQRRVSADHAVRIAETQLISLRSAAEQQDRELQALRVSAYGMYGDAAMSLVRSLASEPDTRDQADVQTAVQALQHERATTDRLLDNSDHPLQSSPHPDEDLRAQLAATAEELAYCKTIITEYEGNLHKVQFEHDALLLTLRDQIERLTDESDELRERCRAQEATCAELRALGIDEADVLKTIRKLIDERDDFADRLAGDDDEHSEASRYESKAAAAEIELLRVHISQIAKVVRCEGSHTECVEAVVALVEKCTTLKAEADELRLSVDLERAACEDQRAKACEQRVSLEQLKSIVTKAGGTQVRACVAQACNGQDTVKVEDIPDVVRRLGMQEDAAKGLLKEAGVTASLSQEAVEAWWRHEMSCRLDRVLCSQTFCADDAVHELHTAQLLAATSRDAALRELFFEWWLCASPHSLETPYGLLLPHEVEAF